MPLRLSLSSGQGTRILAAGTLSIGRGDGNDWVLPDPERHLSKTHCVVSIEGGQWVLTDLSTNGVHINGARQPTQRDSRTVLTDGDEFQVGDYRFVAEEAPAGRGAGSGAVGGGFRDGGDPLDVDPLDDPLGLPVSRAPDPAFSHPVRQSQVPVRPVDPFDQEDDARSRAGGDAMRRASDPDADLFRGVAPAVNWTGPSQPDHADAPRHAMPVPRVVPPAPMGEIDFDALIGDLSDLEPGRRTGPAGAHGPARAAPTVGNPFDELDAFIERASPPGPVAASAAAAPPPAVVAPAVPAAPAAGAPAAAAPGADGLQAAVALFLAGAGVEGLPRTGDAEATLRAWGQVFRVMTEGLREVLMSRATVKGELQVEQTMIKATGNNPLKFAMTPEDAVLALLSTGRTGYMPPLAAAREAFDDVKTHELAVMAGVQTALVGLLRRFDPDTLEARLVSGKLASVLPAARKARLWENFRDTYKTIASEAEDDFQAVFGRAFAKAYMAQTRKE